MSETLNFFSSNPHSAEKDQITASELALTYHGVQHQHSYLSQDCGTKLGCRVFSDSKMSKKMNVGYNTLKIVMLQISKKWLEMF